MTPEEKKQFEEWQLKTENRMNFLVEQQAQFFIDLEGLKAAQIETTKKIDRLAEVQAKMQVQAEADREVMRGAISEMREGVAAMVSIAEQLAQNVIGLTRAQQGNSQRIALVESRLDRLENPSS